MDGWMNEGAIKMIDMLVRKKLKSIEMVIWRARSFLFRNNLQETNKKEKV